MQRTAIVLSQKIARGGFFLSIHSVLMFIGIWMVWFNFGPTIQYAQHNEGHYYAVVEGTSSASSFSLIGEASLVALYSCLPITLDGRTAVPSQVQLSHSCEAGIYEWKGSYPVQSLREISFLTVVLRGEKAFAVLQDTPATPVQYIIVVLYFTGVVLLSLRYLIFRK